MKVNEEAEVLTVMAKEVPVILIVAITEGVMIREVRILIIAEAAVVGEEEILMDAVLQAQLMVATEETEILMVAVAEAVMAETTKIIRAITRWCLCLEHPVIAPDQDAVCPSVSPKKGHGLVFEN